MEVAAKIAVGPLPLGLAAGTRTKRVYVASPALRRPLSSVSRGVLSIIDYELYPQQAARITVGRRRSRFILRWRVSSVYVAGNVRHDVSIINDSEHVEIGRVSVGKRPHAVVAGPDGARVYVAYASSGTVSILDPDGAQVAILKVGQWPLRLAFSALGRHLLVANGKERMLSVINTDDLHVTATVDLGSAPIALTVRERDRRTYVAHRWAHSISVLVGRTYETISSLPVGVSSKRGLVSAEPWAIAVEPTRARLLVGLWASGRLVLIDPDARTKCDEIQFGTTHSAGPTAIATGASDRFSFAACADGNLVFIDHRELPPLRPYGERRW